MKKGIIIVALILISSINLVIAASDNSQGKAYGLCLQNCSNEITHQCKGEYISDLDSCNKNLSQCINDSRNLNITKKELNLKVKLCRAQYQFCKSESEFQRKDCQLQNMKECRNDCKNQTEVCPNVTRIVCGENNVTYMNKCLLDKAKVKKACEGTCPCKVDNKKICDVLGDKLDNQIKNVEKCSNDSDCVIGNLNLPCDLELCSSAYNKNVLLSNLNNLSLDYKNSLCVKTCPMYSCKDPSLYTPKCDQGTCKMILTTPQENKCTSRSKICPMIYSPVCGWFDSTIRCLKAPCAATYSNSCVACSDKKVDFWTSGECPK